MTGFTLPGMMLEPACIAGEVDLTEPRLRTGRQQPEVVADLRQLHRVALERRGERHERAGVAGGLDEVAGRSQVELRDLAQVLEHGGGVTGVRVVMPVPIAVAPMLISNMSEAFSVSRVWS